MENASARALIVASVTFAALSLFPGCSSDSTPGSSDGGVASGDGSTGKTDGGGSSSSSSSGGTPDAGSTDCFSGADSKTYSNGDKGCSDVYHTAYCENGQWTSTHLCDGSNCYCSFGSCMGGNCL